MFSMDMYLKVNPSLITDGYVVVRIHPAALLPSICIDESKQENFMIRLQRNIVL